MPDLKEVAVFSCGNIRDNIKATFYNNGTLIIRGEGDMMNYTSNLPPWFKLRRRIKSVIVMKGVRKIGNSAFTQMPKLSNIYLFDTVEEIGKYAFIGCPKLEKVILPAGADHEDAFDAHVSVEKITVVKNFSNIGAKSSVGVWATLYSNGHLLVEGHGDMQDYTSKKDRPWKEYEWDVVFITVKKGVKSIGSYVFKGFYNLISVEIEDADGIKRHAFEACKNLVDIRINDTIKEIGMFVFARCDSLLNVPIPDVKELSKGLFASCKSLKTIHIPDSVITIGTSAFIGCTSLESVTGMNNVENIESFAFSNCGIKFFIVPTKVKELKKNSFYNNKNLETIILNKNIEEIGEMALGCNFNLINVEIPNDNKLKRIKNYAFSGCEKFVDFFNVKLDNLELIERDAFFLCSSLKNINIQTFNKIIIKQHAFRSNKLNSVILPKYVELEAKAFETHNGNKIHLDVSASPKYSKMTKAQLTKLIGAQVV